MAERTSEALCLAVLLGCVTGTTTASAAPTPAEVRAARQLFLDAEKDEDAGRWTDALDKLHRVAEVRTTAGVRYHTALCEENLGHLVKAYEGFKSARDQARADGAADVLGLVGKPLADLEARIPRISIHVLPAGLDAAVKLDDAPVPSATLAAPLRVDPGVHRVEAMALQRVTAQATVTVQEHDVTSIDLQLLEPPTPPPAPAPTPAPALTPAVPPAPALAPAPSPSPPRGTAILATAGAAALLAGGIGAFLLAGDAANSGAAQCATQRSPCDSQKTTVRALDLTALGAWGATAALGTWAFILWTRSDTVPNAGVLVVGPGSAAIEGRF